MRKHGNWKWCAPSFFLEAFGVVIFLGLAKMLGLDVSSRLGGWLGERIGPLFKRNHIARENLERAMPELSPEEVDAIIRKMWRNVGRALFEYAHLNKFKKRRHRWRLVLDFSPKARAALARHHGRGFFFSGHFTNWELMPLAVRLEGISIAEIYQRVSNPYVNFWVSRLRKKAICPYQVEKRRALRGIVYHIHSDHAFAALVDQKMLSGVWAWFFHRPAQTSEFPASLAVKQNYALIPCYIRRADKGFRTRFHMVATDPIEIDRTDKSRTQVQHVAQQINYCLEMMIREQPDNWLWLHNRWPDPGPPVRQARSDLHRLQEARDRDLPAAI